MWDGGRQEAPQIMEEEEKSRANRKQGLKSLRYYSRVFLAGSVVSFILGIASLELFAEEGVIPYVIPIGMIAGILAFIPSASGMAASSSGLEHESKGEAKDRKSIPTSVKTKILVAYVFAVINFTFLLICVGGLVIGVVLCVIEDKNCWYSSQMLPLSIIGSIVALFLLFSSFFFSIWFCRYKNSFGIETDGRQGYRSRRKARMMEQQLHQQQQRIAQLESQLNNRQ